jgi:hypothetical protein
MPAFRRPSETNLPLPTLLWSRGIVFDPTELHVTPTTTPTRMTAWLEQAWLVRYLNRRLSGEEVTWFESYLLDKPELLAMIEADTRLRDALAAGASTRHTERSVERDGRQGGAITDNASVPLNTASRPRRRPAPWIALAATLALGVGVGSIAMRTFAPSAGDPGLVVSPTRIVYDALRGADSPPHIEHADSASPYVFVEVAVPPGAEQIVLLGLGASEQALTMTPDGFVNFLLERRALSHTRELQVRYVRNGEVGLRKLDLAAIAK